LTARLRAARTGLYRPGATIPTVMTASEIAPAVRSRGAAASRAIREITSTVGCLLILPGARLGRTSRGKEHAMRIGFPGTGSAARHLRPEVAGPEHEVPPEPDMIDQDTAELAYRRGAGIEVALLWHRTTGELTVSVTDAASGASFELPVAPDEALTAFHHPYAYAAVRGVP
jgi:hypothetical protein